MPAAPGPARLSDLPRRIAFALPAAAIAIGLVVAGGVVFAAGVAVLGLLALREAYGLMAVPTRLAIAGALALVCLIAAALTAGREALIGVVAASMLVLAAIGAIGRPRLGARGGAVAAAVLGVAWVGVGLAHGVLLRELDHGGGLVLDLLLAVFIGDTAAHIIGSLFGRHQMAPSISPRKTVEGLIAGLVVGTAAAVAGAAFQPWLASWEAALLGLAAASAAVLGDLFESMVKREAEVKDSGGLLGPHGGFLDRIDAILFAAPAGFYVALALL